MHLPNMYLAPTHHSPVAEDYLNDSNDKNPCFGESIICSLLFGFLGGALVKKLPASAADARDRSSIPGLGRPFRVGNGNPLQYSFHGQRSLAGYSPRGCRLGHE